MRQILALILNVLQKVSQILFRILWRSIEKRDRPICRNARADIFGFDLRPVRLVICRNRWRHTRVPCSTANSEPQLQIRP